MIKNSATYEDIKQDFEKRKIPVETPGFYDHPNFLLIEEKNASYLSNYAKFVHERPRAASYDDFVKKTVPLVVNLYQDKHTGKDSNNSRTEFSNIISKALEKAGVWNYVVKGSVTIDFPSASGIPDHHFWSIDYDGYSAAHTWIVAPPFYVVDVTLDTHAFSTEEAGHLMPTYCAEANAIIEPELEDILTPDALTLLGSHKLERSEYLAVISPQTEKFLSVFPSREISFNDTTMKYFPLSVSAADLPFEQMTTIQFDGQTAFDVYESELKDMFEQA
jgi:hypothetical protein